MCPASLPLVLSPSPLCFFLPATATHPPLSSFPLPLTSVTAYLFLLFPIHVHTQAHTGLFLSRAHSVSLNVLVRLLNTRQQLDSDAVRKFGAEAASTGTTVLRQLDETLSVLVVGACAVDL